MAVSTILVALVMSITAVNTEQRVYSGMNPVGYPTSTQDEQGSDMYHIPEEEPFLIGNRNSVNRAEQLLSKEKPSQRLYENFRRESQYPRKANFFLGT